jgi:uncharacterized protein YbjT (DUF2867 family)
MYVVTGATGNTGKVVARTLLAKGQPVRAIGRSAERLQSIAAEGAEPWVADLTDESKLAGAFRGARAVYVMVPPEMASDNYRAYQDRVTNSIAAALEGAGVAHAVSLSSVGADKNSGTGPVVGLHNLEQRLNSIAKLNVLHVRAGYFMENTLAQIPTIQKMGMAAGPLRPDLKVPMIAARDIGAYAAEAMLKADFGHGETRELLGQRDLSMAEVASILGRAMGKPDLKYAQVPDDQFRAAMTQFGGSRNIADLILEMAAALNSGYMRALEPRSERNTTPISYEAFISEELARTRGAGR